ncbi:MAG: YbaB/EbfC family nucleoid-associated protein [Planctomycetes bacterium]|nr:YbaB/EbfC family nucleoid-associated protein [Planctomycetota bacterium]
MFKQMGQIASMMKNLPKMKAAMEELQQKMGQIVAEGNAGGGMVTAKVNGRMEVVSCTLSDEVMKMQDKEMIEDLIVAALNQAIVKVNQLRAEETSKLASTMGMPISGDGMPGLV